jgi:plastocyanin
MMKRNRFKVMLLCSAVLGLSIATDGMAEDHLVEQKNKAFTIKTLKAKVGDTLTFKNTDPFNHNIFSLSDVKSFDLGSYPQGQSRTITMDKPGTVEIECSIHPDMKMTVEVTK